MLAKDGGEDTDGWRPGPCQKSTACGMEAACRADAPNSRHRCICTHDGLPPSADMGCNRRTVPSMDVNSAIHVIISPPHPADALTIGRPAAAAGFDGGLEVLAGDASPTLPPHLSQPREARGGAPSPVRAQHGPWTLAGGLGLFGAALLVTVLVVWWARHRFIRGRKKQTPRSLSKGPLGSEMFLPNPQYSIGMTGLGLALAGDAAPPGSGPAISHIGQHELSLQESIGEGYFGKVYRGEMREADGSLHTVAVKVLKESATRQAEEDFMREVEVMAAFNHPHILRLVGVVPRGPQSAPCMVFEFMPFGDLTEVLRCSSKNPWAPPRPGLPPLTQEALLGVALQIALGMRYLAAQRFVHRDLACRNCLVGQNLTVKIADFGMSRDVYTCDYYKMGGSRTLPVRWMSPEALLYFRFTLESDVWSFGVVLWEIFTRGKHPYYGHANEEAMNLVQRNVLLQVPDGADCPRAVVDLMHCCWKSEPRDRLRFPEICARLESALEEAVKGLARDCEPEDMDMDLPRPPGFPFPAAYPSLPALPDDLPALGWYSHAAPQSTFSDADIDDVSVRGAGPREEGLLDPENYLLPRAPDPSRVQYMEPIAD